MYYPRLKGNNYDMGLIWNFIRAALPWVAMGLLLAIFFAWSAVKKKKGKKQDGDYGAEGMCLGMCFGTALGGAIWNDTGIGISFGMMIGLVIGSMIHKNQDS